MKTCRVCGLEKSLEQFCRDKRMSDKHATLCKACESVRGKAKYQRRKVQQRERRKELYHERKNAGLKPYNAEKVRKQHLRSNYGISMERYDEILAIQNGVCAVCKQPETRKNVKYLHVDHDHATGEVRGLLCCRCNTALGMLRDTPEYIESLLEYIRCPVVGACMARRAAEANAGEDAA